MQTTAKTANRQTTVRKINVKFIMQVISFALIFLFSGW